MLNTNANSRKARIDHGAKSFRACRETWVSFSNKLIIDFKSFSIKKTISFFLLFIAFQVNAFSQTITIESLRKDYYKLNTDSIACKKIFNKIQNLNSSNNSIIGYKGAIYASMANYAKSKQEKIKLFNDGKKMLEQSIKADSSNVELRFLRLTIQTNCPKALGYHKQINSDKNFIVTNFNTLKSSDLKSKMLEFLIASSYLSPAEKQKIKP